MKNVLNQLELTTKLQLQVHLLVKYKILLDGFYTSCVI